MEKNKKKLQSYFIENPITIQDDFSEELFEKKYLNFNDFLKKIALPLYLTFAIIFLFEYLGTLKVNIFNIVLTYTILTFHLVIYINILKNNRNLYYHNMDDIGLKEKYIAQIF